MKQNNDMMTQIKARTSPDKNNDMMTQILRRHDHAAQRYVEDEDIFGTAASTDEIKKRLNNIAPHIRL